MSRAATIAFVCPRFSEQGTVGGAETLLKKLAERAAAAGRRVTFLTTCAESHFTWDNTVPPGTRRIGNLTVHFFPVDPRDTDTFQRIQQALCAGAQLTLADEETWVRNSVNSSALYAHLRERGAEYDRIVMGPYLYGLIYAASAIHPTRTLLAPCLHDEPFAYLDVTRRLFERVGGCLFNSEPERDLARRLFCLPERKGSVVGLGLDPFEADPKAFAARRGLAVPYVIYAGRRESGKGTPLLCDYMQAFRERTGLDIKLVFTGSGPIEAPAELQPHILDVGFVTEEDKQAALAGALAFAHPSTLESLGIVLLEAFLAGTPALVHAGSDVLTWQCRRSGAGFWFRHYPEFEEELLWLAHNEDARRRMGAAGKSYVLREYDWAAVERRFFQVLDAEEG
jgi:glycosyltransferase involved in cell wall biosynthesis